MRSRRPSGVRPLRPILPPAIWALLILALTSVPGSSVPATGSSLDKIAHFGLYLVLGLLVRRGTARVEGHGEGGGAGRGRWLLLPALAIFAGLDELHQAWIPGRDPSAADWLADLAGIAAGLWTGGALWPGVGRRADGRPGNGTSDGRTRDGA